MNDYEARKAARIERMRDRAQKAQREASARFNSHNIQTLIGMGGEPIKVGHHSERRHRRLIEKADRDMGKGVEAMNKANYYEQRAEAAESNNAISSDDPEALDKLRDKLAGLERKQDVMKQANKMIRTGKADQLVTLGISETAAADLVKGDFCGRVGFPSYSLQNNNANIKRVRDRIAYLERQATQRVAIETGDVEAPVPIEGPGFRIEEHADDNRLWFVFDAKPSAETCKMMRQYGFLWSRQRGAWVRQLHNTSRNLAKLIAEKLTPAEV